MPIISVLWTLAIMAVVATSLLSGGRLSYSLARNALEIAGIEATGEAAVNRAALGLLDPRPDKRWRTDGVPQDFEFNGIRMRISIQDELGRIDINHAQAGILTALLQSAGLEQGAASKLTDKILDWREGSTARRLNGADDGSYRAAGLSYSPRGGPFQSVDELLLVLDMTPELFRRIEPALTVYSGRQFIDPQVAPREALLALSNMDASKVEAALAARAAQPNAGVASIDPQYLRGRAFGIRAEFGQPANSHVQEAAIRLTDDPNRPYWVLNWKIK